MPMPVRVAAASREGLDELGVCRDSESHRQLSKAGTWSRRKECDLESTEGAHIRKSLGHEEGRAG